ncbi:MAG TPA: NAD-dependent dehydratase [Rhodospirillaceae bacterium]|nr:MAG: hypothetical protein A2018_03025 [Alphaproteobacteria bacterium GWF2_58_20]HAU29381.1 NAD-dependent dehydratase [Rhodospirillaceae bacterium]
MKTILVTGGTGFVGRTLIPLLVARGYAVRLAVRQPSEVFPDAVVVGEVSPDTDWRAALSGVDAVIHMAARVHVMTETETDPLSAFREVNRDGTLALARAARDAGISRLVFLSSVKAAAERSGDLPLAEDMLAHPETPYGQSKREAEEGLLSLSGISSVILRPPLVYGPGVKGNFRTLMQVIRKGIPLPLGSVHNRRSLVYVGNLAAAVLAAVEQPDIPSGIYHVCDGLALSTTELLGRVADAMGCKARIFRFSPWLLEQVARLARRHDLWEKVCGNLEVDDTLFRQRTGWKPPFSVEEGLALTTEWFEAFAEGRTE